MASYLEMVDNNNNIESVDNEKDALVVMDIEDIEDIEDL